MRDASICSTSQVSSGMAIDTVINTVSVTSRLPLPVPTGLLTSARTITGAASEVVPPEGDLATTWSLS